jgi:hypothetical protein
MYPSVRFQWKRCAPTWTGGRSGEERARAARGRYGSDRRRSRRLLAPRILGAGVSRFRLAPRGAGAGLSRATGGGGSLRFWAMRGIQCRYDPGGKPASSGRRQSFEGTPLQSRQLPAAVEKSGKGKCTVHSFVLVRMEPASLNFGRLRSRSSQRDGLPAERFRKVADASSRPVWSNWLRYW